MRIPSSDEIVCLSAVAPASVAAGEEHRVLQPELVERVQRRPESRSATPHRRRAARRRSSAGRRSRPHGRVSRSRRDDDHRVGAVADSLGPWSEPTRRIVTQGRSIDAFRDALLTTGAEAGPSAASGWMRPWNGVGLARCRASQAPRAGGSPRSGLGPPGWQPSQEDPFRGQHVARRFVGEHGRERLVAPDRVLRGRGVRSHRHDGEHRQHDQRRNARPSARPPSRHASTTANRPDARTARFSARRPAIASRRTAASSRSIGCR